MAKRPTHEKLKSRANELGTKTLELTRKDLIRLLWAAIEQSSEGIAITDLEGNLQYLNNAFAKKHGYTPDELIGKNLSIFHTTQQMPSVEDAIKHLKKTGEFKGELWHVRRDGTVFPGLMHNSLIKDERIKPIGMMGTLRDISYIKQVEEALQKSQKELKREVKQQTKELEIKNRQLEELNTALKVVLSKKDEDKKHLEENILSNVKKFILPYLKKVKKNSLNDHQKQYLGMLESNLKEIISPFANKLSSKYSVLTPTEIRVADLVKHGKRTKEIATLLNLSVKTIESHREGIRKKIGIKNRKANLRSYLLAIN
jgi:PAS domain S-box-containing protein